MSEAPEVLRRDWTVAHHGQLYQVQTNVRATHVLVEERVDGTLRLTHKGRTLDHQGIAARSVRAANPSTVHLPQRSVKPTADHPWRKRLLPERERHAAVATI